MTGGWYGSTAKRMVKHMDKRKVTVSLSQHTVDRAKEAARQAGTDFSAFADRALRNEILRQQLRTARLPELPGWLDDAEQDEADAA